MVGGCNILFITDRANRQNLVRMHALKPIINNLYVHLKDVHKTYNFSWRYMRCNNWRNFLLEHINIPGLLKLSGFHIPTIFLNYSLNLQAFKKYYALGS